MLNSFFSPKQEKPKSYLFIIGFNKTGTTSLHRLFQKAGLRSVHWDEGKLAKAMIENVLNSKPVFAGYDQKFEVFSDLVYRTDSFWFEGNSLFWHMDSDYQGAKFLYNTRNMEDWLTSRCRHSELVEKQTILELHKKILKTEDVQHIKNYWKKCRLRLEEDLGNYFKGRDNFLELNIEDKDFVRKLSTFVELELDPSSWIKFNETPTK